MGKLKARTPYSQSRISDMVYDHSSASNSTKRLQIGTANFGTNYGLTGSNSGLKRDSLDEIFEIISRNKALCLDTAAGYSNSIQTIANYSSNINLTGRISTKISFNNLININLILDEIKNSLNLLNIDFFSEIYLHGFKEVYYDFKYELNEILQSLIDLGFTKKVGMSCYSESEIISSLKLFPQLTIFQVPENILDQRLIESILIKNLNSSGVKFFVRSAFLQGLLLMHPTEIPNDLESIKPSVVELRHIAERSHITVLELCLQYINKIEWASGLVVGVNSGQQLMQIIDIFFNQVKTNDVQAKPYLGDLIDPRNWNLKN